jgi:hypothetical protein
LVANEKVPVEPEEALDLSPEMFKLIKALLSNTLPPNLVIVKFDPLLFEFWTLAIEATSLPSRELELTATCPIIT